ncbi:MAG: Trp family transcriptional regulator [bacterium]|nr:Trp family transcriptional regulator [bacterium]
MAKFSKQQQLSSREIESMIVDLCVAIAAVHDTKEAAQLLTDLLGKQELEMLAKRLKIAELLLDDETYESINSKLKVSYTTIARVGEWLKQSGEGYRAAFLISKSKSTSLNKEVKHSNLTSLKRKYPIYFWPQILLEQWVKDASKKKKAEMREVLDKLGDKRNLYKELDRLLVK